jgi:hypothetical protein
MAAGSTHLVVTLYNQIAFLDKSGQSLTQDKNGKPLAADRSKKQEGERSSAPLLFCLFTLSPALRK